MHASTPNECTKALHGRDNTYLNSNAQSYRKLEERLFAEGNTMAVGVVQEVLVVDVPTKVVQQPLHHRRQAQVHETGRCFHDVGAEKWGAHPKLVKERCCCTDAQMHPQMKDKCSNVETVV